MQYGCVLKFAREAWHPFDFLVAVFADPYSVLQGDEVQVWSLADPLIFLSSDVFCNVHFC